MFQKILLIVLTIIGLVWYYICLCYLGYKGPGQPPTPFDQFMGLSITTISVSLATFVGMLLGLQNIAGKAKQGGTRNAQLNQIVRVADPTWLQIIAALAYVASLLLALYFWYRGVPDPAGGPDLQADPAVSNLGASLLGLIAGALSVILNTQVPPAPAEPE